MLVTRFAPTPSGFLHVGNLVNLVLTEWLAAAHEGRLRLRIDDLDTVRVRQAYVDDVFRTLDWLGISIEGDRDGRARQDALVQRDGGRTGPSPWSMSTRIDRFREARDALMARSGDAVFVCRCSRRDLSGGRCGAGCRDRDLPLKPGETALRLSIPSPGAPVSAARPAGREFRAAAPPGDHVLWRRDDLPAYHLGSVVADTDDGITAIVRGRDLWDSSALQLHLAGLLPAPAPQFAAVDLRHHELVAAPDGHKLSKSSGAQGRPLQHSDELRAEVLDLAEELGASIGISRP